MTVAFDAQSTLTVGTGDRSQTHTPVGVPRGVLVIIVGEVETDTIVGVTYDGAALTEVPLSPLLHTTFETGSVHAFFKGTSLPTGAKLWAVDVSDATDWIAACFTVTADADTEVHDTSTFDSSSTAAPSATLTITQSSFVAGGLYSGLAAPGSAEVAGTVEVVTGDLGADSGEISRGDSIKTGDFAYGWTQASDDGAVLAVAIAQVSGPVALTGTTDGIGAAAGVLRSAKPLAGLAAGIATAVGALVRIKWLLGTSAGAASAVAVVGVARKLLGATGGQATVLGIIGSAKKLLGTIDGLASAVATAGSVKPLAGASTGIASVVGVLGRIKSLAGIAAGATATAGALRSSKPLTGISAGVGAAIGILGLAGSGGIALAGLSAGAATVAAVMFLHERRGRRSSAARGRGATNAR